MGTSTPGGDSLVGRVIAGHRLVAELGSGGMGKVYYAEHQVIGRRAAIKVLNPEVARDQTATSRFLTEARAVNEIQHPNVVEITDIGRDGDLHYIVMPFLEGETLGERLERVRSAGRGRHPAHRPPGVLGAGRGPQARDRPPGSQAGEHLPDQPPGLPRLREGAGLRGGQAAGASPRAGPALTMAGTVVGTPFYMSPEQCRGSDEVDGRSDVYSLAVVLYQALTGQPALRQRARSWR